MKSFLDQIAQSNGKKPKLVYLSNSLECLIEAAQQDKGISYIYDQLNVLKSSNLKRILPNLIIHDDQQYIIYPKYLRDDPEVLNIKDFVKYHIRGS